MCGIKLNNLFVTRIRWNNNTSMFEMLRINFKLKTPSFLDVIVSPLYQGILSMYLFEIVFFGSLYCSKNLISFRYKFVPIFLIPLFKSRINKVNYQLTTTVRQHLGSTLVLQLAPKKTFKFLASYVQIVILESLFLRRRYTV